MPQQWTKGSRHPQRLWFISSFFYHFCLQLSSQIDLTKSESSEHKSKDAAATDPLIVALDSKYPPTPDKEKASHDPNNSKKDDQDEDKHSTAGEESEEELVDPFDPLADAPFNILDQVLFPPIINIYYLRAPMVFAASRSLIFWFFECNFT